MLDDPEVILSLKKSLKKVTDFHLLLYLRLDEVLLSKITSVLQDHIIRFCVFGYKENKENFQCILDFIKRNKKSLKQIHFLTCDIDNGDLISLSSIDKLNLTSVKLISCEKIDDFGLYILCANQNNITELNLKSCDLDDEAVFDIVKYLPRIKTLILMHCFYISEVSIFHYH